MLVGNGLSMHPSLPEDIQSYFQVSVSFILIIYAELTQNDAFNLQKG